MSFKSNKKKVVTFQLVHRSAEDPLNADPNAPEHVLVPISVGEDVTEEAVEQLTKQMSSTNDTKNGEESAKKKTEKRGIGAQYNKYFGDFPDDGHDYTHYFKAIDEGTDDGIFVAPDGSVHNLQNHEVMNVDALTAKLGCNPELFGTQIDPEMPKLVDDTEDPLNMDPDLLLQMDDPEAGELPDDFISHVLDLEQEEEEEDNVENDRDSLEDEDIMGNKFSKAMSRASFAPSHSSHISHRSEAMDFVEQKVDHLVDNVYNEEEEEEEDEEDSKVDWNDVINDMKQYVGTMDEYFEKQAALKPVVAPHVEQEEEEEAKEEKPKKEEYDCQSFVDTYSTTENHPEAIRDNRPKKEKKQRREEEKEEDVKILPPEMQTKPGETKEEAKERKKAVKEFKRQRRAAKKATKQKFMKVTQKVSKSIAACGGSRGQTVVPLE